MRYLILLLALAVATPASAQSPETEFQRALRLERTQGDYAGAISIYEGVVADASDRPLRGRAMIQLARAYENLGRAEAARTYQRVLADFSDMDELVVEARAGYARTRVAVEEGREPEPGSRNLLEIGQDFESWGSSVSPTGRFLVGASYTPPGVRIFDLATGEETLIPVDPGTEGYAEYPRFSPDESKIALGWYPENAERKQDLMLIDVKTGDYETLIRFQDFFGVRLRSDFVRGGIQPQDWTADGSEILVYTHASTNPEGGCCGEGWTEEVYLVPTSGAEPRLITTLQPNTFSWENACLSADGQFAFADTYSRRPGEANLDYVSRIDLKSGDVVPWRRSDGVSHRLHACTDSGSVLYSVVTLGSELLTVAESQDLDGTDDRLLASLDQDNYASLGMGSKKGDLVGTLRDTRTKLFVSELNDADWSGGSNQVSLSVDGHFASMAWSPDGSQLAFVEYRTGRRGSPQLVLWSPDDQSRRYLDLPDQPVEQLRWMDDSVVYMRSRSPSPASWETLMVDTVTGESTLLRRPDLHERGLGGAPIPLSADRWLDYGLEQRDCRFVFSPDTWDIEPAFCVEPLPGLFRRGSHPSPYGDEYLFRQQARGGPPHVSLATRTNWEQTKLTLPEDLSDQILSWVSWISPSEVLLEARRPDEYNERSSIWVLDVHSGESRQVLSGLLEQIASRHVAIRPGFAHFAAIGEFRLGDRSVTVVNNFLDED